MKKLFFSLLTCALAVSSASALDAIYLVGSGTVNGQSLPGSPSAANPGVEVKGENNVFTFEVENIGWLKISDAKYSNWDGFNGNGFVVQDKGDYSVKQNELGQALTIWYGSACNINPPSSDKYIYELTVKTKNSNDTRLVVTAKEDVEIKNEVYLRGNGNWDSVSEDVHFKTTDYNIYTLSGVTLNSSFKIADGNWSAVNYGYYGGTFPLGETTKLEYNADDIQMDNMPITNATLTFNLAEETLLIEGTPTLVTQDPEQFYVVGTLPNGAWKPNVGVEMAKTSDGIYKAENVVLIEDTGSTGFCVSAELGTDENDWGTLNNNRFGPEEKDTYAVIGKNEKLGKGDLSWKTVPGKYNITFDYKNKNLTLEPVEFENLYLMGTVNDDGWNPGNTIKMVNEGDGIYTLNGVLITEYEGNSGIALTAAPNEDGDWTLCNSYRYGPKIEGEGSEANAVMGENNATVGDLTWKLNSGFYNLSFDLSENVLSIEVYKPELNITAEDKENAGTVDNEKNTIYIKSNAESRKATVYINAPKGVDVYYKLTPKTEEEEEVMALSVDGYTKAEPSEEGVYPVELNEGKGTLSVKYVSGNYESDDHNYDYHVDFPTGVASIEAAEGEAVYFNLHGQKVANPEKGIYVKVVNGKAVKVVK